MTRQSNKTMQLRNSPRVYRPAWRILSGTAALPRKFSGLVPLGWPPLAEVLSKLVAKKIPIYACGACSRARGVMETDLAEYSAKFGNPKIFVSLVEWADKIITE
jgi:hypothetical protein